MGFLASWSKRQEQEDVPLFKNNNKIDIILFFTKLVYDLVQVQNECLLERTSWEFSLELEASLVSEEEDEEDEEEEELC